MKRVQALVSGKKKQCTKLPKPAVRDRSSLPELHASEPPRSDQDTKDTEDDAEKLVTATTGGGSTASNVVTVGSSSSSNTASPSRTASRIPGSSLKKGCKDGCTGRSSSKAIQRQEVRSVSKSKSFNKKSSKEKQKGDNVTIGNSQKTGGEKKGTADVEKMANLEDPVFTKQNGNTDGSSGAKEHLPVKEENKITPPTIAVSSSPALSSVSSQQPLGVEEKERESELQNISDKSEQSNEQKIASPDQSRKHEGQRLNHQLSGQQRLHGILKDSGNNGSTPGASMIHEQNNVSHNYNSADPHPRDEAAYIRHTRRPTKTAPLQGNAAPYFEESYGSLPRNSRSTTPVGENAYNFGSFPRRSNNSTPKQPSVFYNDAQDLGSLARKAESHLGFTVSNKDRDPNMGRGNYATINYNTRNYGTAGYNNDIYGVGNKYNNQRTPSGQDSHRSLYSLIRNGSSSTQYFSDGENGRYRDGGGYPRSGRAGSVPLGYESDSGAYVIAGPGQSRFGSIPRNYESRPDYGVESFSGLRATSGEEQYRAAPEKRPIPRRHTVGGPGKRIESKESENDRRREAFMQLLAQRYPQYADRIQGVGLPGTTQPLQADKPLRSREGQRRRTALVTYNPNLTGSSLDYEDLGTMTDVEVPTFQRGGFSRTSLPIVRSASTSLDRPLGLVFLVYGDQTKKSLLPNEITTLDTVRALFVRAFPDLTLEHLENPRKKIYLLDPATNIYFQLEDLADIKDRSVLKIHETDNDQPQKVKERQEIRGRTVQMPMTRSHSRPPYGEAPPGHSEGFMKSHSLPQPAVNNYQDMMQDQRNQWELERRSRSRTPESADRSQRSLSAGSASRQRFSHSPDRLPTPDRIPLNPIPENRQIPLGYLDHGNYYENVGPGLSRGQHPSGIYDSLVPYVGYPTAPPIAAHQAYIACSTRAPGMAYSQRASGPSFDLIRDSARGVNAGHNFVQTDAGFQRSQSYRIPPTDRGVKDLSRSHSVAPTDDTARNRIEKMEQQLANLTAWVHYQKDGTKHEPIPAPRSLGRATSDSSDTFPASSASKHNGDTTPISTFATSTNHVVCSQGLSDIHDASSGQRSSGLNSRESTPLSAQAEINARLAQLKSDLHVLRKQQQLNMEAMKDEFAATCSQIKKVLTSFPEIENQANFQKKTQATVTKSRYISNKQQINKELGDLEANVEELRSDVISKQCRVNTSDIDGISHLLSNVIKALTDLKGQFRDIYGQMKHVVDAEIQILSAEERFLKEEPTQIENSLTRCKHISDSLSQLKRLSSGQSQNPSPASSSDVTLPDQRKVLADRTEAVAPDKQHVPKAKEVAERSDERKDKTAAGVFRFDERTPKQQPFSVLTSNKMDKVSMVNESGSSYPSNEQKPIVASKPSSSNAAASYVSTPASFRSSSVPSHSSAPSHTSVSSHTSVPASGKATSTAYVPSTSAASNVASVKPSFSLALTAAKQSDKPTATVSAMTGVSDVVTTTDNKPAEKQPGTPVMKNVYIPFTPTTERLVSAVQGGTENTTTTTPSPKDEAKSPKKKETPVYNYQVCGPVNPVFPISPVFNTESLGTSSSSKNSQRELKDNITSAHSDAPKLEQSNKDNNRPPDLPFAKGDSVKKGSVSFSDPPVTNVTISDHNPVNGHSAEKADLTSQKQIARSAFFSSWNSSPGTPPSPNRHSASLDPGPVLSPTGVVAKLTDGNTINLVLTGSVSPKSPLSPGSFNVVPTSDLISSIETRKSSTHGIPQADVDNSSSSNDSQSSASSDSSSKQKKVPPPPPPRQGSRPSSVSSPPANGVAPDLSVQQSRDMPKFVGGILGQHRHSGGPLFSTPKSILQQKPIAETDQNSANGNYVNTEQPDVQIRKNSSQDKNKVNSQDRDSYRNDSTAVPRSSSEKASSALDEHDSSSESSNSSSGTITSQHSIASVVRSSSLYSKDPSKSKPDPPKRHSSLLSKFTSSKQSKHKINNGKAKVNGVDF